MNYVCLYLYRNNCITWLLFKKPPLCGDQCYVVLVRVVTSIVVMSWPLLLGGLLLSASPAMSGSIRPGYNMIPMSYPPHPLPYPPEMTVRPLRSNRTTYRLSYPEHDPRLPHKRYSRRVQEEIKRRTEAMMRRNSPSMKKIRARIASLGMHI